MSEANIDLVVKFNQLEVTEKFYEFLNKYSVEPDAKEALKLLLNELGLDGEPLFNSIGADSDVSDVILDKEGELQFHIFGGVHGGSDFAEKLQSLMIKKQPKMLFSVLFNDQVGEWQLQTYDNGKLKTYYTGDGNDVDEELYDALNEKNPIDVFREYYSNDLLDMHESDPVEEENVAEAIEILEDEDKFNEVMGGFLFKGLLIWAIIFLTCWLAFDYLWSGLLIGGLIGTFYSIKNALALIAAKKEHENNHNDIVDELKSMGLNNESAEQMTEILSNAMKNKGK